LLFDDPSFCRQIANPAAGFVTAMLRAEPMENESLQQQAQQTIEEARMVLPGIQALFGFQLIAIFNTRFQDLTLYEQCLHFSSLLLVALAIALIMTPAAYHRIVERGTVSHFFIDLASRLIAIAMIPLMFAIALEVLLLGRLILGRGWASLTAAGGTLAIFAFFWFLYPLFKRNYAHSRAKTRHSQNAETGTQG
jgi:hypothetical protein